MRITLLIGSFALVLPLVLAATAILRSPGGNGDDNTPAPTEIRVENFTFAPETHTVSVTSAVTRVNNDDVPQVIASNDGLSKSRALDARDKYSFTFSKGGTHSYYRSIHPKIVGKIVGNKR